MVFNFKKKFTPGSSGSSSNSKKEKKEGGEVVCLKYVCNEEFDTCYIKSEEGPSQVPRLNFNFKPPEGDGSRSMIAEKNIWLPQTSNNTQTSQSAKEIRPTSPIESASYLNIQNKLSTSEIKNEAKLFTEDKTSKTELKNKDEATKLENDNVDSNVKHEAIEKNVTESKITERANIEDKGKIKEKEAKIKDATNEEKRVKHKETKDKQIIKDKEAKAKDKDAVKDDMIQDKKTKLKDKEAKAKDKEAKAKDKEAKMKARGSKGESSKESMKSKHNTETGNKIKSEAAIDEIQLIEAKSKSKPVPPPENTKHGKSKSKKKVKDKENEAQHKAKENVAEDKEEVEAKLTMKNESRGIETIYESKAETEFPETLNKEETVKPKPKSILKKLPSEEPENDKDIDYNANKIDFVTQSTYESDKNEQFKSKDDKQSKINTDISNEIGDDKIDDNDDSEKNKKRKEKSKKKNKEKAKDKNINDVSTNKEENDNKGKKKKKSVTIDESTITNKTKSVRINEEDTVIKEFEINEEEYASDKNASENIEVGFTRNVKTNKNTRFAPTKNEGSSTNATNEGDEASNESKALNSSRNKNIEEVRFENPELPKNSPSAIQSYRGMYSNHAASLFFSEEDEEPEPEPRVRTVRMRDDDDQNSEASA